ncbi:MAG: 2-amino-4-hydroxy-6-hydroxymethyldihydropteridine diphosphokinase [Acidobacteria bacterium]|nr:2-amino-4-hydroxy-6-hydroxymethyldihydropteridine diphosphokinase [Acidobacteriota bacterium]
MRIYLALGSNLGDRESYLRAGLAGLAKRGIQILRCASVYSAEPKDVLDQPWFLNTVILGSTTLSPRELLHACLDVEAESGRRRNGTKGPRTLDIDIIFYDSLIVNENGIAVPHPRFAERRFVLVPLAELSPDFVDPISGKTIRNLLLMSTDAAEVQRFGPPLL